MKSWITISAFPFNYYTFPSSVLPYIPLHSFSHSVQTAVRFDNYGWWQRAGWYRTGRAGWE